MATKAKTSTYNVQFKLNMTIAFDIEATSFNEAVTKAEAMKMSDIVDFGENGWDHCDSDEPVLQSVYKNG